MSSKTLTRIGALLRKAESTDNPHEAEAYLEAAQRLATEASVDLAVARAHTDGSERREVPIQREIVIGEAGKRGLRTYVELFVEIARANDVRCDVARNSTRVFAFGFAGDVDTVSALYASLIVQMVRASDDYVSSKRYTVDEVDRYSTRRRRWERRPVSPITARLSFQRAFAARIGARLADARRRAEQEAKQRQSQQRQAAHSSGSASGPAEDGGAAPSVALALRSKELELADHYRQHSTARGTWRGSSASAGYAERASRAGDRAGRRARIGTEQAIGGARRQISP